MICAAVGVLNHSKMMHHARKPDFVAF